MTCGARSQRHIYYHSTLLWVKLTETNRVNSAYSCKVYHQMSRLHRTLNTEWNGHDDRACASVMILNILSLTAPKAYIGKDSTCCLASLIRESVCPLKMLPSNGKNSST